MDGHDMTEIDRTTYLRQCGTVMQDTFIFAGTVAHNLRISKPDATDEELLAILAEVELTEWLSTLTDGLNHDLESGSGLSAGQKQRIGIARAILPNPKILLLDEPTSALDAETEAQIVTMLQRLCQDRTTLVVTHRLETVVTAHQIIVLNQGLIEEQGTHNELLAKKGLYAELFRLHRTLQDTVVHESNPEVNA